MCRQRFFPRAIEFADTVRLSFYESGEIAIKYITEILLLILNVISPGKFQAVYESALGWSTLVVIDAIPFYKTSAINKLLSEIIITLWTILEVLTSILPIFDIAVKQHLKYMHVGKYSLQSPTYNTKHFEKTEFRLNTIELLKVSRDVEVSRTSRLRKTCIAAQNSFSDLSSMFCIYHQSTLDTTSKFTFLSHVDTLFWRIDEQPTRVSAWIHI